MEKLSNLSLSNLLLSQIISGIDDNVDIICLLLTCKKLYYNRSLKRSISFNGIEAFNNKGETSKQFIATVNRFNLMSFQDILENSIPDHQVISRMSGELDDDKYPKWIQDRIIYENRVDKIGITTAIVGYSFLDNDIESSQQQPLYDTVPSIKTLFICHYDTLDLVSFPLPPQLQHLSVDTEGLKFGPHTSLKSLVVGYKDETHLDRLGLTQLVSLTDLSIKGYNTFGLGPGLLPSTLTCLSLKLISVPPRDTFALLTSLVKLKISFSIDQVEEHPQFIDLEDISTLETFKFFENAGNDIEISLPPSLKVLDFLSYSTFIASRCTMPLLERLYVDSDQLISISAMSSPFLKKLTIRFCQQTIPDNVIPSTLEKLTLHQYKKGCLGNVVLPSSLIHLSIKGYYEPVQLPQSLVKLKQVGDNLSQVQLNSQDAYSVIPSSCPPPYLETLNLLPTWNLTIVEDLPPTIKYLSISLIPATESSSIYSIASSFNESIITQQHQWLSTNTTHLTCRLSMPNQIDLKKAIFRLDQVINHTNVRYLSINIGKIPFQFSIQRLDPDNLNVLVLETKSLQGGIITQHRTKSGDQTNQQQQPHHQKYESTEGLKFGPHASLKSLCLEYDDPSCLINDLGLDQLVSLTDLCIKSYNAFAFGPCNLPTSLTSLSLNLTEVPLQNTFRVFTSLVTLEISFSKEQEEDHISFIDLEDMCTLTTFKFMDNARFMNHRLEISVPPSLKVLQFMTEIARVSSEFGPIPANVTPPSLEKLKIYRYVKEYILDQVLPSSLIHLTIVGVYTPTIKYLSISLVPDRGVSKFHPIYSISSKLNKPIISQPQQLPPNITHLTCRYWAQFYTTVAFRLDEVINHTNVRYLDIIFSNLQHDQFSIQRLDPDNNNVLVLETKSLQGGIINQKKTTSYQQQYDPIYLYFDILQIK
ncbi:hypothetical protein DFA_08439 [Cavenderia fasciculata]|uniref:Uncharacterized protein n=1 Tax=Cavenderia fasciculata TaxID=261658 RepID=F4Q670_CACFS|nr:uncharacterized protein DFA_08439 [Cavenderia fasciculata]EGG17444.1 hypothetical protein DFA_08439 [Cavenderia fasciculata]|eukprot:XP_004355928.1 hypothetical protein DFA_08439 [Cavenderia fasciculata]